MTASPATPRSRKLPVSKRLLPVDQLLASEPMVGPFVGEAPPDRYAERIVAGMARWLVGMRVYLDNEVLQAIRVTKSHFGSPKAQQRLAARLRKAGGWGFLDVSVKTGKRGRFTLRFAEWCIYDPATHKAVDNDEAAIPDEPWLECLITVWQFPEGGPRTISLFVISHHALTRLVQRCGAREPFDLIKAFAELYARILVERIAKKETLDRHAVHYFDVAGGKAVVKYDDAHKTEVVITVLDREMQAAEAAP